MTGVIKTKTVLVTDDVHPILLEGLQKMGYQVDFRPDISMEECLKIISQYHGLIINSKIVCHAPLLKVARRLTFIGRLGSGMEIIDLIFASHRGIRVFSSPEGNAQSVAEHATGMLLNLMRHISKADGEMREGRWLREVNRGMELNGKTVGIFGYGHTGSRFAHIMQAFGCRVLAYDKYFPEKCSKNPKIIPAGPEEILAEADIISLHVSHPIENQHMVNHQFLSSMKPGAILINTSRGMVVNTSHLLEFLKTGHLKGACLDVFEIENPSKFDLEYKKVFDQLIEMPNVVLTPHIAGWTHESKLKMAKILLEQIENMK